jgi:hypothetical protein
MTALAVALTFGVAACGGGDDGGGAAADSPLAKALAANIQAEEDGLVNSEEEAECWAGKVVSEIGEDRLTELGMTEANVPDIDEMDFTSDEVSSVVESMFECIDVKAAFTAELESDFGAEAAGCLADGLDEEFVKEILLSEMDGSEPSDEFMQNFLDIAAECDIPLN